MKRILLITLLLFITASIFSQTNYYPESIGTKVFHEDGYIYKAERKGTGYVEVYNSNHKWIGMYPVISSTGESPDEFTPQLEENNWTEQVQQLYSILEESYSTEEKKKIKESVWGNECYVNLYINPQTGKVDDVRFSFYRNSYYMNFSVSRFREIELKIKNRLQFITTDYGKQLNFIYYWDDYHFK